MSGQCAWIAKAIVKGYDDLANRLSEAALAERLPPLVILNQGVVSGINKTGELLANSAYFLPDVILSADALGRDAMMATQKTLELVGGKNG